MFKYRNIKTGQQRKAVNTVRIEKRKISRDKKIHLPEAPIGAEYIVHVLADGKIVLSPHKDNQPEFIVLDNKIQPVKNTFYRKLKELVEKYREGGLSSEETALAESMMEKSQEAYAAVWAAHKDTTENDLWTKAKGGCDID